MIVRPKYAPKTTGSEAEGKNDGPILIAELPSRFIDKCIADESLLRVILTDKYLDHCVPRMSYCPDKVVLNAGLKMREGPSKPAYRSRFQTTLCCIG
ncbi:MAG: hypothetical protein IPJ40_23320 [Saprospirales bacterium]|nr:hypothetical protein [Saprospirales bacterium]